MKPLLFISLILITNILHHSNGMDPKKAFRFDSHDKNERALNKRNLWTEHSTGAPPQSNRPPWTDDKEAQPHYQDVVPPAAILPTPAPTEPNVEPMVPGSMKTPDNTNAKIEQLGKQRVISDGQGLTTLLGVKVSDNQNTLQVGHPGPILHEDFIFTEKVAHFNRERIPERVVHARGSGAHGVFRVYRSLKEYTTAAFLQDPNKETPVFVRFSLSQGSRGAPDTLRDIRGFATKFYTEEGNMDLVGNDSPIFWIQDPIKFPDFIHALKPEPHNEIPQEQSAHDSFWDFITLQPETLHNLFWAMSDRGIPRSYRTLEGFGLHSFRLINAEGRVHYVKFHWKPVQGKASLVWDEAQLIAGRDPDFHRKDLWQAIEAGDYPEYELGMQLVPEEDADKFDFDLLDATKLIPESVVPVQYVGRMTLNRNPDNFFAEVEQVAFCPANIVPGIDFSDDPLLQGRVFYYGDTQRHRLGTANFNQIPINRPISPVHNHLQDGVAQQQVNPGANYEPNSISGNWPREVPPKAENGGFRTLPQRIHGVKSRNRSATFSDYYTQPRLFWISQTPAEQRHMIDAFSFELTKVSRAYIRERMVDHLSRIDTFLASSVAKNLGITLTQEQLTRPLPVPTHNLTNGDQALSLYKNNSGVVKGRRVNVLLVDGVPDSSVEAIRTALKAVGVHPTWLAPHMGNITTASGRTIPALSTYGAYPSVLADGVIVADPGTETDLLIDSGDAKHQVLEAYKHLKPIALLGSAKELLGAVGLDAQFIDEGVCAEGTDAAAMKNFLVALGKHRVWDREDRIMVIPV